MRILLLTMNKGDATSYYRAAGVIRDLERRGITVDMFDWPEIAITWPVLSRYDIIWMQRPGPPITQQAVNAMNYCRQMGRPVVLDFDDNLFNVPMSHENAHGFAEMREGLILLLRGAAAVMVSTVEIARDYAQFTGRVRVVPNAVPDELLRPFTGERTQTLLYRGMRNHLPDVYAYSQHFQQLIKDGYKLKFMGLNPYFLSGYTLLKGKDIYQYFEYFRSLRVRALMFPMVDNKFNRSRSNIAWLEATMAGTVCVAPNWEEWKHPGIIHCGPENFYHVMVGIMKGEYDVERLYRTSYEWIRCNRVVSVTNNLREGIFAEVAAKGSLASLQPEFDTLSEDTNKLPPEE